jgi:hypothetical protein
MIDRFVARGAIDTGDECIGRIVPEGDLSRAFDATEVVSDCLTDQEGERHASPSRLILELAVGVLGESKIGRHVARHAV